MAFVNLQVDTDTLPSAAELEYQSMPAVYRKEALIQMLMVFGLIIAGLFAFRFLPVDDDRAEMVLSFLPLAPLLAAAITIPVVLKQIAVKAYALRERDIAYRSGLFFRKTVLLAFNRVQHIEVSTGPLQRRFGLATLKFFTAGGASVDLKIEGLLIEDAERLRAFILDRGAGERDD